MIGLRHDWRTASVLVMAALTVVVGCSDNAEPMRPVAVSCVIQGTVSQFEQAVVQNVFVRRVAQGEETAEFTIPVTEAGTYRAELPAGDYLLSIHTLAGTFYYTADETFPNTSGDADTVRLDPEHSPVTANFRFGALRFEAPAPAAWGNAKVYLTTYRLGGRNFYATAQAPVTDGRCDVTMRTLPPGDYQAKVSWELDSGHQGGIFWLPGYRSQAEAQVYHVGRDTVTSAPGTIASSPARLVGHVGGVWREMGFDPPSLVALDPDSVVVFGPWQADVDGNFDLALPGRGPVKLKVTRSVIDRWVGGDGYADATVFAPEPGEVIAGIEFTGGGVRVRVAPTGLTRGSDWARLTFHDPQDLSRRVVTGGDLSGQIGIANLPVGDWLVHVETGSYGRRAWRPQWLDRSAIADGATVLHIPADVVRTVDLVLEAGGAIRGQVDRPVIERYYTYVAITDTVTATFLGYVSISGSGGDFALTGLSDGSYRIGVVPFGLWPAVGEPAPAGTLWYPGTTDWATAGVVTINDAGTVDGLVLTAP